MTKGDRVPVSPPIHDPMTVPRGGNEKKFCHFCGHGLIKKTVEGRERLFCEDCTVPIYENPPPATAAVVFDSQGRVLLVKRNREPKSGQWCLPGGFMELDETPEEACLRELKEETGLDGDVTGWLGNFHSTNPFYKWVLLLGYRVENVRGLVEAGDDCEDVGYFHPSQMPPIAFSSHRKIFKNGLEQFLTTNAGNQESGKDTSEKKKSENKKSENKKSVNEISENDILDKKKPNSITINMNNKENSTMTDSMDQNIKNNKNNENNERREIIPNVSTRLKDPGCFGAYVITSGDHIQLARKACEGGAKVLQYRDKKSSRKEMFRIAREIRKITRASGTMFIINDYIDLALLVEADGLHLGQDDIPIGEARKMVPPDFIIGLSTHSLEQAVEAVKLGADYIGSGPVFATPTKEDYIPIGVETVQKVVATVEIPVVAIGGLTLDNIEPLREMGVKNFAMVRAFQQDTAGVIARVNGVAKGE